MTNVADNNQHINEISYRQQFSTLHKEGQQKTKRRTKQKQQSEAIAISANEIDESAHCFRTKIKRKIVSANEACIGIKKLRRKLRLFQGGRQRLT